MLATNPRRDPGVEDRRDATSNLLWSNANRYLGSAAQVPTWLYLQKKIIKILLDNSSTSTSYDKEKYKGSHYSTQ